LLLKPPKKFTESKKRVATALRWCRLSALSRLFSGSSTIAFILDWIALETLAKNDRTERFGDSVEKN